MSVSDADVDNEIFDRDADAWWSDDSHLTLLHGIVPARLDYLAEAADETWHRPLAETRVLDVGCGGGLFAEELTRLGCQVSGIDPSAPSIAAARLHAEQQGIEIAYEVGSGESLPYLDESFDVVCCCDVLEHADDPERLVAESARVLSAGGLFLYDTINRTWLSRLLAITLLQRWEWLRIAPPGLHAWDRFIKPQELRAWLLAHGLTPRGLTGLAADMRPVASIRRIIDIRRLHRGEITYAELGKSMVFRPARSTAINYMGYATR